MKLKIIGITIGVIAVIIVGSFTIPVDKEYSPIETWGSNEHFYESGKGWQVVCDVSLVGLTSNCQSMNKNGEIVPWPTVEEQKLEFNNNTESATGIFRGDITDLDELDFVDVPPEMFNENSIIASTMVFVTEPVIGMHCPQTHYWNTESQRCDIAWNSPYVVQSIIIVFYIIIISAIIILYYWRKSKRKEGDGIKIKWIFLVPSTIMLFLGIPLVIIPSVVFLSHPDSLYYGLSTVTGFYFLMLFVGLILTIPGILLLYKSKLIRN